VKNEEKKDSLKPPSEEKSLSFIRENNLADFSTYIHLKTNLKCRYESILGYPRVYLG